MKNKFIALAVMLLMLNSLKAYDYYYIVNKTGRTLNGAFHYKIDDRPFQLAATATNTPAVYSDQYGDTLDYIKIYQNGTSGPYQYFEGLSTSSGDDNNYYYAVMLEPTNTYALQAYADSSYNTPTGSIIYSKYDDGALVQKTSKHGIADKGKINQPDQIGSIAKIANKSQL